MPPSPCRSDLFRGPRTAGAAASSRGAAPHLPRDGARSPAALACAAPRAACHSCSGGQRLRSVQPVAPPPYLSRQQQPRHPFLRPLSPPRVIPPAPRPRGPLGPRPSPPLPAGCASRVLAEAARRLAQWGRKGGPGPRRGRGRPPQGLAAPSATRPRPRGLDAPAATTLRAAGSARPPCPRSFKSCTKGLAPERAPHLAGPPGGVPRSLPPGADRSRARACPARTGTRPARLSRSCDPRVAQRRAQSQQSGGPAASGRTAPDVSLRLWGDSPGASKVCLPARAACPRAPEVTLRHLKHLP